MKLFENSSNKILYFQNFQKGIRKIRPWHERSVFVFSDLISSMKIEKDEGPSRADQLRAYYASRPDKFRVRKTGTRLAFRFYSFCLNRLNDFLMF